MPELLVWRVDHQGVHDLQVRVGPDTTVGEVAASLVALLSPAGSPPGPAGDEEPSELTLVGDDGPVNPHLPAVRAAPLSGTTVGIGRWTASDAATAPALRAPVHLLAEGSVVHLDYGANRVHPGAALEVDAELRVRTTGATATTVDGSPVRGCATVPDGALLRSGNWVATAHITGFLRPPGPKGPWRAHAARRGVWPRPDTTPLELTQAPEAARRPGMPWLTLAVPIAMALAIWFVSGSLLWAGFMAFTVGYVLAAALESRHEARAEERFRLDRFAEDLADATAEMERRQEAERHNDELRHPGVEELLGWFEPPSTRIWERGGDHPAPLILRLGTAQLPSDMVVAQASGGRLELRRELRRIRARLTSRERPVTLDIGATGGIAVVGDPAVARAVADALVLQLATLVPPGSLSVSAALRDDEPHWSVWLPHSRRPAPVTVRLTDGLPGDDPDPRPVLPIWVGATTGDPPRSVRAVLRVDHDGTAELMVDHEPPVDLRTERTALAECERAARLLAGMTPGAAPADGVAGATLGGSGLVLEAGGISACWAEVSQGGREGLVAPIGVGPGGGVVHVDLESDGPHALVAGTTGSGKSELLRSWIAGLAVLHPPSRLNLLLVDYKGGASFGPLVGLPHCAGVVTDLTPGTAGRAVAGLRAELKRRERLLHDAGASAVRELGAGDAPPALVVVIDEFATMAEEVPAFLEGVLDVARRGRSLGIHVIMATQRPSGVISDAIRANTALRIALRLPDADDSRDVIDSPAAASLPRDEPGAAVVRFAHDSLVRLRVAHSGGPVGRDAVLCIAPLGKHQVSPSGSGRRDLPSELEQVVGSCREVARRSGADTVRSPWAEPLPDRLELTAEAVAEGRGAATALIGHTDLVDEQRHGHLELDLAHTRGILAVGAPRSGTSTTLVTLATMAAASGWRIHAIDAGGGLGPLDGAIVATDHELVHRLLRGLCRGVDRPSLLVIDDLAAFDIAQRGICAGEAMDLLVRLTTSGTAVPLLTAASVRRRADVPSEMMAAFAERLVHRCIDVDSALAWDVPEWMCDRELPAGRVWHRGVAAQVGLCVAEGPTCARPPTLPDRLSVPQLARMLVPGQRGGQDDDDLVLPIGLEADSLEPASLDLRRNHGVIAGSPASGKTTCLLSLADMAAGRGVSCVGGEPAAAMRSAVERASSSDRPVVVLLDDAEDWLGEPDLDELLLEVIGLGRRRPLRVVLAGDAALLTRIPGDAVDRLRTGRCGILLGEHADDHDHLLHCDLRPRHDLPPAPGRGWLVNRGSGRAVQLAVVS